MLLAFQAFTSSLDPSFWNALTQLKIDVLKLDDRAISLRGVYNHGKNVKDKQTGKEIALGCFAEFDAASLQLDQNKQEGSGIKLKGTLKNFNTIEAFKSFDKQAFFEQASTQLWQRMNADATTTPVDLNPFFVLTFADLKKFKFYYWFCFPALLASHAWEVTREFAPLTPDVSRSRAIAHAFETYMAASGDDAGCALLDLASESADVALYPISAYAAVSQDAKQVALIFCDPSSLGSAVGWPVRNVLTYLAVRHRVTEMTLVAYRGADNLRSVTVSIPSPWPLGTQPRAVGWEKNRTGKLAPNLADLSPMLDPSKLADQAVDLNLKLMRWRILPDLNLDKVKSTKCLLLGAGTLGCYVARVLMAWGVQKITLVDSATVSFSNPVRQPLFEFEDCLNGGKPKAAAAAAALKSIYPHIDAEGISLSIPMPGHPIPPASLESVRQSVQHLEQLIDAHDVIYLLMDSRESRWLPTVLGQYKHKLVMNAALGFDTYLVMRHGLPSDNEPYALQKDLQIQQLGCYYCSDITAARDSLSDQTLDQMCTVTRPGLAAIASATAVELMVSVLQHPKGIHAPSDAPIQTSTNVQNQDGQYESVLGMVPHQIRGFLSQFKNMTLTGQAYNKCTGCSKMIVDEYAQNGFDFVKLACEDPAYLEKVTGLDKMAAEMEASMAAMDWADEDEEEGDDF